jgi:hypothetical protein
MNSKIEATIRGEMRHRSRRAIRDEFASRSVPAIAAALIGID